MPALPERCVGLLEDEWPDGALRLGRLSVYLTIRNRCFGQCPLLPHPPPAFVPGAAASWLVPVLLFPEAALGFLATCSVLSPLCLSHCPFRACFSRHGRVADESGQSIYKRIRVTRCAP